jgi:thiol:disulfide interchange protein DsbA
MLKNFTFLFLFSFASLLQAAPTASGYETISPAQPTQNQDKIEIIEFFWYGCPHCYSLEPLMVEWLKTLPDNVEFIRQPAIFNSLWGKHAKAYFVAESLGVLDKIHEDFFDAVQNKKQKLASEDQLAQFFVAHGVDKTKFHDTFNSFLVDAKVRQAQSMAPRYGITGVPALIINGKYKTSGPIAGSHEEMIKVMNKLIEQEGKKLK